MLESNIYIGIIVLVIIIVCLLSIFKKLRGGYYATLAICLCVLVLYINEDLNKIDPNKMCLIGSVKKYQGLFGGGCLDIWHVQHVLFWMIIGILWPGHIGMVLLLSIAWELLEHIFFKYRKNLCQDFFCGRYEDIIANVIGYIFASEFVVKFFS